MVLCTIIRTFYPPPPPFFCKLTLNNGEVVELQGSGELTSAMTNPYSATCVNAEVGTLCTSIGDWAFYYFPAMTSCTISSGVTSIGYVTFWSCTGLTSITIPDSVTSISGGAFDGCSAMTTCTLGSGVTSIGDYAFCGCWALDAASRAAISAINQNALNCDI